MVGTLSAHAYSFSQNSFFLSHRLLNALHQAGGASALQPLALCAPRSLWRCAALLNGSGFSASSIVGGSVLGSGRCCSVLATSRPASCSLNSSECRVLHQLCNSIDGRCISSATSRPASCSLNKQKSVHPHGHTEVTILLRYFIVLLRKTLQRYSIFLKRQRKPLYFAIHWFPNIDTE